MRPDIPTQPARRTGAGHPRATHRTHTTAESRSSHPAHAAGSARTGRTARSSRPTERRSTTSTGTGSNGVGCRSWWWRSSHGVREPGFFQQALGFEGADLVGMPQGQADVVEAVEQAVLAKALDLERQLGAIGLDDDLALEVDRELVADEGCDL